MTAEWKNEPNEVELVLNGFDCRIERMPMGHLCGYVRIPEAHPWYLKSYSELDAVGVDAHGGLTFSGRLMDAGGYWIGFDCAHSGDLIPSTRYLDSERTYKNIAYVTKELEHLTKQAKAAQ